MFDFIGGLNLSRRTCGKNPLQRRKSTPPPPPKNTKNKTKEEESCGKLLKKTPAGKYPVFKPARSRDFQIGARKMAAAAPLTDARDLFSVSGGQRLCGGVLRSMFFPSLPGKKGRLPVAEDDRIRSQIAVQLRPVSRIVGDVVVRPFFRSCKHEGGIPCQGHRT